MTSFLIFTNTTLDGSSYAFAMFEKRSLSVPQGKTLGCILRASLCISKYDSFMPCFNSSLGPMQIERLVKMQCQAFRVSYIHYRWIYQDKSSKSSCFSAIQFQNVGVKDFIKHFAKHGSQPGLEATENTIQKPELLWFKGHAVYINLLVLHRLEGNGLRPVSGFPCPAEKYETFAYIRASRKLYSSILNKALLNIHLVQTQLPLWYLSVHAMWSSTFGFVNYDVWKMGSPVQNIWIQLGTDRAVKPLFSDDNGFTATIVIVARCIIFHKCLRGTLGKCFRP